MYFSFDLGIVVLFKHWRADNWMELIVAMLFTAAMTIAHQSASAYQSYITISLKLNTGRLTKEQCEKLSTRKKRIHRHILATFIYMLQLTFAYIVMLLAMTYQGFIMVAIVLGAGIGFYVSDPFILVGMDTLYQKQRNVLKEASSEEAINEVL